MKSAAEQRAEMMKKVNADAESASNGESISGAAPTLVVPPPARTIIPPPTHTPTRVSSSSDIQAILEKAERKKAESLLKEKLGQETVLEERSSASKPKSAKPKGLPPKRVPLKTTGRAKNPQRVTGVAQPSSSDPPPNATQLLAYPDGIDFINTSDLSEKSTSTVIMHEDSNAPPVLRDRNKPPPDLPPPLPKRRRSSSSSFDSYDANGASSDQEDANIPNISPNGPALKKPRTARYTEGLYDVEEDEKHVVETTKNKSERLRQILVDRTIGPTRTQWDNEDDVVDPLPPYEQYAIAQPLPPSLYVGYTEGLAAAGRYERWVASFHYPSPAEMAKRELALLMSNTPTLPDAANAKALAEANVSRLEYDWARRNADPATEDVPPIIESDSPLYWTHTVQAKARLDNYRAYEREREAEKKEEAWHRKALGLQ